MFYLWREKNIIYWEMQRKRQKCEFMCLVPQLKTIKWSGLTTMTWTVGHQSGKYNLPWFRKLMADGQPNNTIIIQTGSSPTVERDPGENRGKGMQRSYVFWKSGWYQNTTVLPLVAHTSHGCQPKAALSSGSEIGRKGWKKLQCF